MNHLWTPNVYFSPAPPVPKLCFVCMQCMFVAMGTNAHAYMETRGGHHMSSVTFHSILLRKGTYLAEPRARLAASKPTGPPVSAVLVLEVPELIPSFVCTGLCVCAAEALDPLSYRSSSYSSPFSFQRSYCYLSQLILRARNPKQC